MSKIMLSLPSLTVTERGWERNKEIYTLALATDMRGADPKRNESPIAAYNETLPNVAPAVQAAAALKWVVVSVSNIFERVRADQPVSLSGSGIILYPNLDPKGMLALHLAVIESDARARDIGKTLMKIVEDDGVKTIVKGLTAAVTQPLLAQLMNLLIGQIPKAISRNRDDLLFTHNHSGFDFDDYGLPPGMTQVDFPIGNDMVKCALRVRVNP